MPSIPPHRHCPHCGISIPVPDAPNGDGDVWECACGAILQGDRRPGGAAFAWAPSGEAPLPHCTACHQSIALRARTERPVWRRPAEPSTEKPTAKPTPMPRGGAAL